MMTGFVPRLVSEPSEMGGRGGGGDKCFSSFFHPGLNGASFEPGRREIK